MVHRLLLLLSLVLEIVSLPQRACAQSAFKPGYLVQLSGDTLRGEVQVRGAMRSAQLCRFRSTAAAAATDYQPTQLRGYGIDQVAIYHARVVPALGAEPAATLFVKALVIGTATLYTRQDADDQTRYYLAMNADSLQELRQFRAQRLVDNQMINEEQSPFRAVLARAFRDCLPVQPLLPRLALATADLTNVVRRYNQCVGGPALSAQPLVPKERSHLSAGVVGGVDANRVNFSAQLPQLRDGSFTAASPLAGVFVTFTSPQLNRNLALRLDVLYERISQQDAYVARNVSTVEVRNQASFKWSCLRVPLQVRYHFNTGLVRPFLFAGASANYLLSHDSYLRSEYTSASGTPIVSERAALDNDFITRVEYGLLVGAGLTTSGLAGHAIGLEVRGERGSGFLSEGLASPTLHLAALLSINLTK